MVALPSFLGAPPSTLTAAVPRSSSHQYDWSVAVHPSRTQWTPTMTYRLHPCRRHLRSVNAVNAAVSIQRPRRRRERGNVRRRCSSLGKHKVGKEKNKTATPTHLLSGSMKLGE